ncbi:MAG: response regulator transcription factor [Bacillota bacterium]|nr:response regulator transcription factor [Bacillota bacterium]
MAGETILIVDDDEDIREVLTLYLKKEGYQVISAEDGSEAVTRAFKANPDLIILDMMLPGLDGVEVCQEIRKKLSTPIIFLSCKGEPLDKSIGLTAGGDDYMSKPFDALEILARVKAHLRRNRMLKSTVNSNKLLAYQGLSINLTSLSVVANNKPVLLSPKEFQLLVLLAESPNKVFSSEELFQSLWGTESFGDHRTVMVHISNIRRKVEQDPAKPIYIKTIKGAGYKFCTP